MELTITPKDTINQLHDSVYTALNYYSNVHRGSGQYSTITTQLYEKSREIVLDYLALSSKEYSVIFCSPRNADIFVEHLESGCFKTITSRQLGIPLGIAAVAVQRKKIPAHISFHVGGGTTRLVSTEWILWAKAPERYEIGTPPVINIIAFTKALAVLKNRGNDHIQLPLNEKIELEDLFSLNEFEGLTALELLDNLQQNMVGLKNIVPTTFGEQSFVNLDYSASTPAFKPVWEVYKKALTINETLHPKVTEFSKSTCARFLNASLNEYDVLYSANTTEAINIVAENLKITTNPDEETMVVSSLMEHSSNDLPWRLLGDKSVIHLPISDDGFFDLVALESLLTDYNKNQIHGNKRIKLVALSGASNVLGTCNDMSKISKLVHAFDAKILVDAAQLVAHRKVDVEANGFDYLAFSAHKIYAPFGVGVLLARKGLLKFNKTEQDTILSSGEENIPGIAALTKSLLLMEQLGWDVIQEKEQQLTSKAIASMLQMPGVKIRGLQDLNADGFKARIGVIAFELKGMMATKLAKKLALHGGIGIRAGCHCAHVLIKRLLNFGPTGEKIQRLVVKMIPQLNPPGMARISFGIGNTPQDVQRFLDLLEKLSKKQTEGGASLEKQVEKEVQQFIKKVICEVYECQ